MGLNRRTFLQAGAAAAGGLMVPSARATILEPQSQFGTGNTAGPNDRIRFGMIGVGMEGAGVLASALSLPGAECVAAADLYDGRHTLAKEITNNPNLPTTRRYQEILERRDIDCVL